MSIYFRKFRKYQFGLPYLNPFLIVNPNLFNILEAFQRKESWGHQIMRDFCMAVGVNHDQNKERTKARVARR